MKEDLNNILDTYGLKWEQASDTYVVSCQSLNQLAEIFLPNDYNFKSGQEFTVKDKIGAFPFATC